MKYRSPNPGLGMVAVVLITVAVFAGFFTESIRQSEPTLVPEVGEMMSTPGVGSTNNALSEAKTALDNAQKVLAEAQTAEERAKTDRENLQRRYAEIGSTVTNVELAAATQAVNKAKVKTASAKTAVTTATTNLAIVSSPQAQQPVKPQPSPKTPEEQPPLEIPPEQQVTTPADVLADYNALRQTTAPAGTVTAPGTQAAAVQERAPGTTYIIEVDAQGNKKAGGGKFVVVQYGDNNQIATTSSILSSQAAANSAKSLYEYAHKNPPYTLSDYTTTDGQPLLQTGGIQFNLVNSQPKKLTADTKVYSTDTTYLNARTTHNINKEGTVGRPTEVQLKVGTAQTEVTLSPENFAYLKKTATAAEVASGSFATIKSTDSTDGQIAATMGGEVQKITTNTGTSIYLYNDKNSNIHAATQTVHYNDERVIPQDEYNRMTDAEKDKLKSTTALVYSGGRYNAELTSKYPGEDRQLYNYFTNKQRVDSDGTFISETFERDSTGKIKGLTYTTLDADGTPTTKHYTSKPSDPGAEASWEYQTARAQKLNFNRMTTQFRGLSGWSSILMGEEAISEWRETIDESFGKFLGMDHWVSMLCQSQADDPPESVMTIETSDGLFNILAHAEAERSQPITNPENGTTEYLYKITWAVTNPERAQTEVEFMIFLYGPPGKIALYPSSFSLNPGDNELRTGEDAVIQYSNYAYTQICIEFKDDIPQVGGGSEDKVCNTVSAAPTVGTRKLTLKADSSTGSSTETTQNLQPGGTNDI
ncbi:MAG: hypothetical protein KJ601_03710 [Nanoarchaeota archaeon]|nr:hypothetical protein [Nanoarchaeota archaeon]MBU1704771.1 hypothetical protein [Nanoarchaeota archaeon]